MLRSYLTRACLLMGMFALGHVEPALCQGAQILPCDQPLAKLSDCDLQGPVHVANLWYSSPDKNGIAAEQAPARLAILAFSEQGRLIQQEIRVNGASQSLHHYSAGDDGLTVTDESEWTENSLSHRTEDVLSFDKQGEIVSRKSRMDGGPFAIYFQREFDTAGREISLLRCSTEGKYCSRTESEYDERGRLILQRYVDVNSDRVNSYTKYEYPAKGHRLELDFNPSVPASDAAPSVPTWIIDATFDSAGRVIEQVTSAPGQVAGTGCGDCPHPGHIERQYDDHGHLMKENDETSGSQTSYTYDEAGNVASEHITQSGRGDEVHEYVYQYDEFGNWTSKTSYTLDSAGNRGKAWRIEYRKLTYYPK